MAVRTIRRIGHPEYKSFRVVRRRETLLDRFLIGLHKRLDGGDLDQRHDLAAHGAIHRVS
jgi:hypothetical protein